MKLSHLFPLFLLFLCATHPAFAAENKTAAKDCHQTAVNGMELENCAKQDVGNARAELDKELAIIKARHSDDPERLKKLEEAQKAWESFMKAQIDLLYFDRRGFEGSMCIGDEIAHLVQIRTNQLRQWAAENVEGDVCGTGL